MHGVPESGECAKASQQPRLSQPIEFPAVVCYILVCYIGNERSRIQPGGWRNWQTRWT